MVRRRVQKREAMMLFCNVLGIQFENKQTGMSLVSCGFSFWFRSLGRLKYRIGIKTPGWLATTILGESLFLIVYPAYLYGDRNCRFWRRRRRRRRMVLYSRVVLYDAVLVLESVPLAAGVLQLACVHGSGDLTLALNELEGEAGRGMPSNLGSLVSRECFGKDNRLY